jgi:hypothetical protein
MVKPVWSDWEALAAIARNVNRIVDDAVPVFKGLDIEFSFENQRKRSQLQDASAMYQSQKESILKALPDAESLGESRAVRLANLKPKIKTMTAYIWLDQQTYYKDALATIGQLAVRDSNSKYASDIAEFQLLDSIVVPLEIFSYRVSKNKVPQYPTRSQVTKILSKVRDIDNFLKNYALSSVISEPNFLRSAIVEYRNELESKHRSYRKPKDNDSLNQRLFCDDAMEGLMRCFGDCSPTLLLHLCGLGGYEIGQRELEKRVSIYKQRLSDQNSAASPRG